MYSSTDSAIALYYLGDLNLKNFQESTKKVQVKSNEERVIDFVEEQQMCGKFRTDSQGCSKVRVHISMHGVKMIDEITGRVLQRIPLINCLMAVSYCDFMGRFNLVLVEKMLGSTRSEHSFVGHVLQSINRSQADGACKMLENVFAIANANHQESFADSPNL